MVAHQLPVTSPTPPRLARRPILGRDRAQRSFDELGTPLHEVTFVVIDLETTGAQPARCGITEIGAVKARGGEVLGTFQTLINPGVAIPPMITVLTGITEAMVMPAPTIDQVLPTLLEFIGDAVIIGHNVRFDVGFLNAALLGYGYDALPNRTIDTVRLARRLVRSEVPNCKLGTLAAHFRVTTTPSHRAFDDARATLEVFYALLERAGTIGVLGLDDLCDLPSIERHPSASKLALTAALPRTPGVYLFKDRHGNVLYVGKATNLRARVRSYFGSDDRRKIPRLLRETEAIDVIECATPLEAAVREIRLIQQLEPPYNRQSKGWRRYAYLKLTRERFPRLAVVRQPGDGIALGPFATMRAATLVREAIETALPIRRCTTRIGMRSACTNAPCMPAQLGVAVCPCSGGIDDREYASLVDTVARSMTDDAELVCTPLTDRMRAYASGERFEEAAETRDRLTAFVRALQRHRLVERWRAVPHVSLDTPIGRLELHHGVLQVGDRTLDDLARNHAPNGPCPRHLADEILEVARWIDRNAHAIRVIEVTGELASAWPGVPDVRAAD
ncbi:MAG: DEDD exonuclease domain-containing protein [Acidimicrobiia bacterium]